jgi:hypothetical protein
MNWELQKQFEHFEKPSFCRKKQLPTHCKKKKIWQIHEMINQVDHREGAGPQTAERVSFVALVGPPRAFCTKKTNNSM